ncbi:tumor necrosis factor receptor superfamily member 1A-like [Elgaria multicarinata webbii]|uniref:tumor necrosis factor receptor superfamily member 1A-like n=1 Tax=Elgaria multicarinata webbii TaxID=159646 RepID=UPI002FCD4502
MAPLGLFPVLVPMIKLILIQMKTGESLGLTLIRNTIQGGVADKEDFIHSSGRERREQPCQKGYFPHPNGTHCCYRCHRGTYVAQHCLEKDKTTTCLECPPGTYMSRENYANKCLGCQDCRSNFGQIVISSCTSEEDTVCGCAANQFRTSDTSEFFCKNCSACHNGTIRQTCTTFSDTVCECHYGFFLQTGENNCSPCSSCQDLDCKARCEETNPVTKPPNSPELTSLLSSLVVIFGVGCLFLLARRIITPLCQRKRSSTCCSYPSDQQSTKEMASKTIANDFLLEPNQEVRMLPQEATPTPLQGLPDCVRSAGETQIPDCPTVLYTVVDHVPLSRWKEFVRRLGLSENAIERINMEQRHMREAQYEMLRQWRLQAGHGATVERISNVLNQMELSGCSEAIQEVLTKQP